jgi:hypothetical protein
MNQHLKASQLEATIIFKERKHVKDSQILTYHARNTMRTEETLTTSMAVKSS